MALSGAWAHRVAAFLRSPADYLSSTTCERFLQDLLHQLQDGTNSESSKMLLLAPLLEFPDVLCLSPTEGQDTAQKLLHMLIQTPYRCIQLRCQLMVALTNILLCTSCVNGQVEVTRSFLDLLFVTIQDTNDNGSGQQGSAVRSVACDCLREMETCCSGLLSQKLEALYLLKQQETTPLHQAYCLLYTLALKNAIHVLCLQKGASDTELRRLLSANEGFAWHSAEKPLPPFPLTLTSRIPVLQHSSDSKELKSVVSLLLEESYLMTPLCQAAVLRELVHVVLMIQALPSAMFKSQLLRLLGTVEVALLHVTLLMKGAFTDSLFTAEDENFLVKRLVSMARHPLLSVPHKLFCVESILHFPENRPISSSGEESLPVLVTPRLAASLLPTVFNDSRTMLCRLNLLSLVYVDSEESNDKGIGYLFDHLMALYKIVENSGTREMIVTFFKAAFKFLLYFYHNEKLISDLTKKLCQLYSRHYYLAPNLINLIDQCQTCLEVSDWSVQILKALQKLILQVPLPQLTPHNLRWHLKLLGRISMEADVPQRNSLFFLLNVLINSSFCSSGHWRMGNAILVICRNLLQHPSLHQVFIELADLLQYMMHHYEDVDIQDRSRFYYTMLTNLSREKLCGILAKGPDMDQAKIRSLSSIMAETEGVSNCLTINGTKQAVLKLVRMTNVVPQAALHQASEESQKDGSEDVASVYHQQFLNPSFACAVLLRYQLEHTGEADTPYHQLFSICLHFQLTDSNYEDVGDINVPCLFKDRKPPAVLIKLKPRHPYPSRLHVSAVFTTEDGLSWHSQMADILVSFSDLFLPVPAPAQWSLHKGEQLFDHMWRSMSSEQPSDSTISLYCFEVEKCRLHDLIDSSFRSYIISEKLNESYKVMFFLPPRFHVLLDIKNAEDAVQVNIATDNWHLLPFINSYLKSVTAQTPPC